MSDLGEAIAFNLNINVLKDSLFDQISDSARRDLDSLIIRYESRHEKISDRLYESEDKGKKEKANSQILILKATEFAARKHRDQRRKDDSASPYINHPIALASILSIEGGVTDEVVLAAALLHDTIEDTDTAESELVENFGEEVAQVVVQVTDDKTLPKAERKRLQIEHAAKISYRARLVKLADKIANIRDVAHSPPKDWPLERRQEYFDWAKKVVDQLGPVNLPLLKVFAEAYSKRP